MPTTGCQKCPLITEEDREIIFSNFWKNLNWDERKVYVNSLIGSSDVSERTIEGNSRRNKSLKYFLRKNGERIQVCKDLFLSTLGIGEKTVYGWIKGEESGIPERQPDLGNTYSLIIFPSSQ